MRTRWGRRLLLRLLRDLVCPQAPSFPPVPGSWDGDQGSGIRQPEVCQHRAAAAGASQEQPFCCATQQHLPQLPPARDALIYTSTRAALQAAVPPTTRTLLSFPGVCVALTCGMCHQ